MKKSLRSTYLLLSFCLCPLLLLAQEPCECTNCPVPIMDNGTFDGFLDVTVDGPNNLSLCPLQEVCFTITHTWVGDLFATLTSPGGLNYIIMADDNNNFGGCGNNQDNINICVQVGTGNPVTNNTPYICNGPPGTCLDGNWTVACGGVTDPVTGAVQAPNCDLNDFNLPGQPANGTWTLTINDICSADIGFLETWSLTFDCGVLACITCEADGGVLNQPDMSACQGDPSLSMNVIPQYNPGPPPNPAEYSYTFVITQNGIISNFINGPNLGFLPPGMYDVCGLSYATSDAGLYFPYLGQPINVLSNDLNTGNAGFCGDLSSDCYSVTIGPPIPPTVLDTLLCVGDCFEAPDGTICCNPGPCQYTLPSVLGCDSLIIMNIGITPPDIIPQVETLCPGECLTIGGVDYCAPGFFNLEYTNQFGCDSIVQLQLNTVPVVAVTAPAGPITCSQPVAVLNGAPSLGTTFTWTDASGTIIATSSTVPVTEGGCYLLTVGNTMNGVTCTDTMTVCVQEDLDLPALPTITGPATVCGNATTVYTIVADPLASDYVWTIPAGATVVGGGNGTTAITIDWTGSAGGSVCVAAANGCGLGPEACLNVQVQAAPPAVGFSGPLSICPNDVGTYTAPIDPNIDDYTWTLPAGATILSGQGTNTVMVDWGTSVGGNICLTVSNGCGDAGPQCQLVSVGDLPSDAIVSGPSVVCPGDVVTYQTAADPLATDFTWAVSACATILSGQGTNSISVEWGNPCTGGSICVTPSNGCGNAAEDCLSITVDPLPVSPQPNGPSPVCVGDINFYTTAPIAGATNYNWTVTGGSIVSGQGTTSLEVAWNTQGTQTVCVNASTPCGTSADVCLDIEVNDIAATPIISGPSIVCDGSVVNYSVPSDPAASGYTWTTTCGSITAGQNTAMITVDWSGCPGGGDVCVVVESDCGPTAQVCYPVQGGTIPADPAFNGPTEVCEGAIETYCVTPDPNVNQYFWVANGAPLSVDVSADGTCVDIAWSNDPGAQLCLQAENGCGLSTEICIDINVEAVPTAPDITGPNLLCLGETGLYTASSSDPTTTGYTWSINGGCGTILSTPASDQVEIQWDAAGICEVCATADNDCGAGAEFCIEVEILDFPTPDAGLDQDVCGLEATLAGSVSIGAGTWSGTGPGAITFTDPNDPATTVQVNAFGSYTFTWSDDEQGCVGTDEVVISFNPDPMIDGAIVETCDMTGFFYEVTFSITGGQPPYTITGGMGTLTGNTFVSDPIASGTTYTFEVFDALGCGPLLVSGQETCDCVTEAGTMDLTLLEVCEDESVTSLAPTDDFLDPDDTFIFILHTDNGTNGSTLGTILDQNTSGTFSFLPGMNTGETYFISYAVGNDLMPGVDLSDDCTDIAQGQPVIFYAYPNPDAGPDDMVCGLSIALMATPDQGIGGWTGTGPGLISFDDPTDPAATVSVDQYGVYTFTWSEDNNGCLGQDEVQIEFLDDPVQFGVTQTTCDPLTLSFTVTFEITGGSAPYSVSGTVPGVLTGSQFISDPMPSGTNYSFEVLDQFACGPLVITGTETCPCLTDAGTMDATLLEACEDQVLTVLAPTDAVLDGNDSFEFYLHDFSGDSLGQVFDQNTTGDFGFLPGMNYGQTYYISYVVGNDSGDGTVDLAHQCTDISIGQPLIFYENPITNAGADAAICGLSIDLAALPSVGMGSWMQVSGPGTAVFTDITNPNTLVSVDQYGPYTFTWSENNQGCTDTDEVIITFQDDPVLVGVVTESCDLIDFTYTVSFELGGGSGVYALSGGNSGIVNGALFTSDPIPSGDAYSFEFVDTNGCGPLTISGQVTCECGTDAGTMNPAVVEACVDEQITVDLAVGTQLDPEDILLYVLHNGSGPALGTEVYGYNTTPTFGLVPPMQAGVSYYISAIAGNDIDMDGLIDTNDPCVSVALGTPVLFNPLPQVSFAGDVTVCEGQSATLTLAIDAVTCVDVSYSVDGGAVMTLNCLTDGSTITVPTDNSTLLIALTSVVDQNGCAVAVLDQATINVNLEPSAILSPGATICNSTDSGMPTILDFSTLLLGGDQGGTWENTDGASVSGTFPSINFDGAIPGTYTFTYTTASAQAPCQEQSFTTEITVEDCVCLDVTLQAPTALCNEAGTLDLTSLQITSEPGIWAITGTPGGASPVMLNGSILDATGADPGIYELTFSLSDTPPVGCPTAASVELVVSEFLSAGTALPPIAFCEDASEVVTLASLLQGAATGGSWSETSDTPSSGGAFNANAGTFNMTGQAPGTYHFTYTLDPAAPCPSQAQEVSVIVHALPQIDAGSGATLTCFEPVFTLNASTDGAIAYQLSWSAASGSFPGDSTALNPTINQAGTFTLTVTNPVTGCSQTDVVTVEADQEPPAPFISLVPVSCFGESDGVIRIDSVVGGTPPYLFSLNGEPFSSNGFYSSLEPDSYTLVVEDANGCQNEPLTIDITQPQELNVELVAILEGDNTIRLGDSVDLLAIVSVPADQIDSVMWSPPGILSCDTCLATTAYPLETTNFSVMVESNGCTDEDALLILVRRDEGVYVPNGFSPNGDGDNDLFYIYAGPQVARIQSFLVFSRWGEPVFQYYQFEPNNPAYGWDGTHRGKMMDPAVFTWMAEIEFKDGRVEVYKGDVTLVR